ncbi:hypothetical protein [Pseudonocardia nigra]|uniref:hypothetical protein n=1 Tax=Pseudonocardia nigra TaxID=1921578 RepID=UPI001C5D2451|nr:hypothetical protein [Pseudonocardia nigra]
MSVVLLAVIQAFRGPADDPDPAYQRPGILDLAGLPEPASPVTPQVPQRGRPAVVFFERPGRLPALCGALPEAELAGLADLVVVTSGTGGCGEVPVVSDPAGRLADAYGMSVPVDGGPPIGYAVIDANGSIRYRTLAPEVSELYEVAVMVGAL